MVLTKAKPGLNLNCTWSKLRPIQVFNYNMTKYAPKIDKYLIPVDSVIHKLKMNRKYPEYHHLIQFSYHQQNHALRTTVLSYAKIDVIHLLLSVVQDLGRSLGPLPITGLNVVIFNEAVIIVLNNRRDAVSGVNCEFHIQT